MRRKCALCNAPARLYCHSDHAFICWDCDSRVHSANFLAARHSRNLLCGVCHSSTPWNASGARLGQIVSICTRCADGCDRSTKVNGANVDESRRRKDNEKDVENQAVTCSDERSPPPPAAASSSSSQESSNRLPNCDCNDSLKRKRGENNDDEDDDDDDDDDDECCSSSSLRRTVSGSSDSARALKEQRLDQYEEQVMVKKKRMAQDQGRRS